MKTGFVYDPRFLNHNPGAHHPESPERLKTCFNALKEKSWFRDLIIPEFQHADESWIREIHTADYLRHAQEVCDSSKSYLDTPDVGISKNSYDIAKLAAGAGLELADQMMNGKIQNGFALLRPPGHHAESSQALGFCLLNNIAILAKYLQKKYRLEKILILDWDVHHGNGTQHSFEEDPSVFYMSIHRFPFYPGTGAAHENGIGRGKGATLNCPMPAGCGDLQYEQIFKTKILPKCHEFEPDAVLISAGFDAHARDPLGGMNLSTEFFGWMTERMLEIAGQYAENRVLSLLEGGYDLKALSDCVNHHLEHLCTHKKP